MICYVDHASALCCWNRYVIKFSVEQASFNLSQAKTADFFVEKHSSAFIKAITLRPLRIMEEIFERTLSCERVSSWFKTRDKIPKS